MIGANETVSTQRRSSSATGKKLWTGVAVLTDLSVYLENIDPDKALSISGQFTFDMYQLFADGVLDIEDGDIVTDSQSREFTVKGVQKFPNDEIPAHTEATLRLKGTNES